MNNLTKILGIGLLSLASIVGCTRTYKIDGKVVNYNDTDVNPMVVYSDSNKTTYQTEHKWALARTTGKDIITIKIAKAKKFQFKGGEIEYKLFPKVYSIYNPKDSAVMNRERKNFDYYLNKIDSIENSRKKIQ